MQAEFVRTANDLYDRNKQIVITADSPPSEIRDVSDEFRRYLSWGLVVKIDPPDFATRVAILAQKASAERITLPASVAKLLAARILSNVRELEGTFIRLIAFASLTNRPITRTIAEEILQHMGAEQRRKVTVTEILNVVAALFNTPITELNVNVDTPLTRRAMEVAMYLIKDLTSASPGEIAKMFHGTSVAGVARTLTKVERLLVRDASVRNVVSRARKRLR